MSTDDRKWEIIESEYLIRRPWPVSYTHLRIMTEILLTVIIILLIINIVIALTKNNRLQTERLEGLLREEMCIRDSSYAELSDSH